MNMNAIHAPSLASETIASIGAFEIRNTLIMAWLAMAVLIVFALAARSTRYRVIPGRFQMAVELVIGGLFSFFDSILQNTKHTRKAFPIVATIFLFIVTANWMGIFPGVGSITVPIVHNGEQIDAPIFRSMNADINMTLVFALIAVITAQVMGLSALGLGGHVRKFLVMPWEQPYVVGTFVGLLELLGELTRVVSFSFRLFGNIFAGEVLLVVISALMPYVAPIPFLGLEIFVGFIQALVFAMLTLVFISMAVTPHGDHAH
jgi:F-type H+-transporting ATPase subunit a